MEPNVTTDQMHGITIQNSFFLGNAARWQPGHRRQPEFSGRCNLDHPSTTLRATGTIRAGRVGWVVYVFYNGLNHSPNNQTSTVLLENSTSTNDGGYGFERFWDYSNPGVKLTATNVTVTDPQKVLKGDAGFAVNGGGGDSFAAGNIAFSNITVNYTNGYSLPYYFDCGPQIAAEQQRSRSPMSADPASRGMTAWVC